MPHDGRRTVTAFFAFTIIIHNGSGIYKTSSDDCKHCQHLFRSSSVPDTFLKAAADVENSPGDSEGKNFIQSSAQEKADMDFMDYCKAFCKNDVRVSGNFERDVNLRRASEMLEDEALEKFETKKNRQKASVEKEWEFPHGKKTQPSIGAMLGIEPPAGGWQAEAGESSKVSKKVRKDPGRLHRRKRDASDWTGLRRFREGVDYRNGYGDPTSEDYALYSDDYNYKLRYNEGYREYGGREVPEGPLYDEYSFDEANRPSDVADGGKSGVEGSEKSPDGESATGDVAETPGRRILESQDAKKSNEAKPCKCTKEFEKYISALLKDALVITEGALRQFTKWLSPAKSTQAPAASPAQKDLGSLMRALEGPKEKDSEGIPACDLSLGFTHINNLFYPPEERSKEAEATPTTEPHKATEAPLKRAAEVEELPAESDEEESLNAFPTTRQAEREEPDATPEPEATTEPWPTNYVTLQTTTRKMDFFADEPATWTEPVPEFTEPSTTTTTLRPDEENSTLPSPGRVENATQTSRAPAEGGTTPQANAKTPKEAPALCNLRNLKKPQFLPLILEALKYGRH